MGSTLKQYNGQDRNTLDGKTLVIDAYTKESIDSKKILHMDKIVGNIIVESTRDSMPEGLYAHGEYPFRVRCPVPGRAFSDGVRLRGYRQESAVVCG